MIIFLFDETLYTVSLSAAEAFLTLSQILQFI